MRLDTPASALAQSSILYTDRHTDGQTGRFQYTPEKNKLFVTEFFSLFQLLNPFPHNDTF